MKNRPNILLIAGLMLVVQIRNIQCTFAQAVVADCHEDPACREIKDRAIECSKAGDLGGALRLYKLAYEIQPDPRLFYNIARVLHKQGQAEQLSEAAGFYQKFLDSDIKDEEQKNKAREYLDLIQADSSRLSPSLPLAGANSESTVLPATTSPTDTSPLRITSTARVPVYKKWWLWTTLGLVVAGGVAAGVGVWYTRSSIPSAWPRYSYQIDTNIPANWPRYNY